MASVTSLGLASPSGLPYAVDEGILPPDPPATSYKWQKGCDDAGSGSPCSEELLLTEYAVIWSRGGIVRRAFRFDIEKEPVRHACFANFPKSAGPAQSSETSRGGEQSKADAQKGSQLKVKKQRSGPTAAEAEPGAHTTHHGLDADAATAKKGSADPQTDRALVVVLRTQAHIFFLAGTSHLVHLPFEVDAVFPLPCGIVLQRHVSPEPAEHATSSPLPSAPSNSFAIPPSQSFRSSVGSQGLPPVAERGRGASLDPSLSFMSQFQPAKTKKLKEDAPAHLYLRDPLADPGFLFDAGPADGNSLKKSRSSKTSRLHQREELLYMSVQGEVNAPSIEGTPTRSTLLAIAINRRNGHFSVWEARESRSKQATPPSQRTSLPSSSATSRRKSSRLPGTGANTPGGRLTSSLRESFGGARDPTWEQQAVEDELDPASQLDPAFENPGAPAKSSRRISSLLARADLSFARDPSGFPDLAAGTAPRRGVSFGARTSFGGAYGGQSQPPLPSLDAITPDFISSGMSGVSIDAASRASDSDDESDGISPSTHRGDPCSTQRHLVFKRIHTFSANESFSGAPDAADSQDLRTRVFTMKPPANDASLSQDFVVCLLDRRKRQLLILYTTMRSTLKTKGRGSPSRVGLHITDMRRGNGVLDACKIQDETGRSRLLVLEQLPSGSLELTLQSPWSTKLILQLPEKLMIQNLHVVDAASSLHRKRESGFKRVLSDKIDAYRSIAAFSNLGQFDAQDLKGVWHRFQIQLSPTSSLVSSSIAACEFVLPHSPEEREPLLRAWWDVVAWLKRRPDTSLQDEWSAFIVTVFCLFVPFLADRPKQGAAAKRRKAGLLRSSSGANIDQEAFDAMIAAENVSGSKPSTWLQDSSWQWALAVDTVQPPTSESRRSSASAAVPPPFTKKITFLPDCLTLAKEFLGSEAGKAATGEQGYLPTAASNDTDVRMAALPRVLVALHLLCEELKLDILAGDSVHTLTPLLAQLAQWLKWHDWLREGPSCYMLSNANMDRWTLDENTVQFNASSADREKEPPSVIAYTAAFYQGLTKSPFPNLMDIRQSANASSGATEIATKITPRTTLLYKLLSMKDAPPLEFVQKLNDMAFNINIIDSLPETVAALLRSKIAACQAQPGTTASRGVLEMVDRNDIVMLDQVNQINRARAGVSDLGTHESSRDFHAISNSTLDIEPVGSYDGQAEQDRASITRLIFKDDQRFVEASKLLHPLKPAVAYCAPYPEWTEADLLEAQNELVKVIAIRTLSVSAGRGLLYYCGRFPLLTEKFPIHGFSLSCVMKPSNTTVTADKATYTEEKVSWAFFHAGVEAGLSISKAAKGIDTSWITFNKPPELNNRHAGFLLALGLNGHLKSIAKWVAFKYLTPKHTMTSVGLLLGLAASYRGTMDPHIVRLISIHVSRMLPLGAAELNVSALTQTTGIMAIGLMYCNSQHRRMSEVMISEMENTEHDDSISPAENLRDEGYRLAAGFALGFINLGQGKNLKGLHDMHIVERLLALAVATKKVHLVHVLDKATAAATVAIALIFMKTEDLAIARKIDVPDTIHQFDYVRPDNFLLRTVARHLIMWNEITPTFAWMEKQLPPPYRPRFKLRSTRTLHTEDLPLHNILAGLCLSIGLRFAGTAREDVRDLLGHYLDQFMRICALPAPNYDSRLTRITARNCQDTVALAAATVMAGTGDVWLLRRLRALHGRADPDTPYGSHLAAHMALGVLFLGGGTHTLSSSPTAVAALLAAFYPLWPTAVLDNRAHLQAFRHLWVLAAEPRCLVVRHADTHRPLALPVRITLRDGAVLAATAPCLLPALDRVATVACADPAHWAVVLDLAGGSPAHAAAFRRHQSLFVRRRGAASDAAATARPFATALRALNARAAAAPFEWVFALPALAALDRAARARALPSEGGGGGGVAAVLMGSAAVGRATEVDDRLALERECVASGRAERLWNLKALFAWAESARGAGEGEGELGWLGAEVVEGLRARVMLRGREIAGT